MPCCHRPGSPSCSGRRGSGRVHDRRVRTDRVPPFPGSGGVLVSPADGGVHRHGPARVVTSVGCGSTAARILSHVPSTAHLVGRLWAVLKESSTSWRTGSAGINGSSRSHIGVDRAPALPRHGTVGEASVEADQVVDDGPAGVGTVPAPVPRPYVQPRVAAVATGAGFRAGAVRARVGDDSEAARNHARTRCRALPSPSPSPSPGVSPCPCSADSTLGQRARRNRMRPRTWP